MLIGGILGGLRPVLHFADFRVLWLTTVSSQVGQGIQQVVLGWLVLAMTDSEGMVGVVFAVRSAPNLVVGLAAGALTDRLDRRLLMRLAVGGMALISLMMAWLALVERLQMWQLLVCTGMLGMLQALSMTARQVYVYDVLTAGGAVRGIALISSAHRVGGALGALLAGATLQWWGAGASFLVMGLSYSVSLGGLWCLRHPGVAAPRAREPLWENLRAYMEALRTNRVMRSLMISTAAAETLGFSHQVMLPILAKEVLQIGAAGLGLLTAFRFVGGIVGAVLLTALGEVQHRGVILLLALMLFGAGQVLLAQASHFWLAVVCVTCINVVASTTDILHQTLLQYSVPNEQRGRAMGSWVMGLGTAPLGHLEIGYLASLTSVSLALSINGLALITLALGLVLLLPQLRRL